MRKPYRVLVTGSREFDAWNVISGALNRLLESAGRPMTVIHGQCPTGADNWASIWVEARHREGLPVTEDPHPADWAKHGKAAGPIRNSEMVALGADICLAFYKRGVPNVGTADCAYKALKAGIEAIGHDDDGVTWRI